MFETHVGISDLALHIPQPSYTIDQLVEHRRGDARLAGLLRKVADSTGQRAFRFPELWEDTVTMAAQAAHSLIGRNLARLDLSALRYLTVGTETTVDHSKPVAAYVEGALQAAGQAVPRTLSTFQIQHACAGGTLSLLSVGALLALQGQTGESGLVVCSDVARYSVESTAEITQGAGAAE